MKRFADPLLIALFALLFLTTFQTPGETERLARPDSDGKVPVKQVCDMGLNPSGNHWFALQREYLNTHKKVILLNKCYLDSQGAGPTDIAITIAHERAHAAGWEHYQGTPETNKAYYPHPPLCHC